MSVVVADLGPHLGPFVEVHAGEELQAREELAARAEPRRLPGGEGTLARGGIELRERSRPLEDHRPVLDREEEGPEPGRAERMEAGEVATERGVDVRVAGAGDEGAAA